MTTYYVDSAGSNTSPYDTWAKAANSIGTIAAIDAAGDTIYMANTHAETNPSLSFAGTATSPTRIISADKTSGAPPTVVAIGAAITSTAGLSVTGTVYCYGVVFFAAGSITLSAGSGSGGANSFFASCSFRITAAGVFTITCSSGGLWKDTSVKFFDATQTIAVTRKLDWIGGSVLAGSASPTTMFSTTTGGLRAANLDFSNCSASLNLTASVTQTGGGELRNITTPTNWSGLLNSATRPQNTQTAGVTLINSDYAATNYAYQRWDNFGDVYHETTNVMTGGSSDGTTTLAWKLVSQAHAATFPISRLECAELSFWNKTIGVPRTVRLEYLHDNVTGLKNDEFWIDVDYLGSGSTPIGTMVSSAKADVLQAGATNSSSAAVWNTSGLSNPNAQYVEVTFTPQMVGHFIVRMCLAKASYTVYADRKVTVT